MSVEMQPVEPGRARASRAAFAVVALGLSVVVVALAAGADEVEPPMPDRTPDLEAILVRPAPSPTLEPEPARRSLPGVVRCVDVRVPDCLAAVESALALLAQTDSRVREASARTGIICGDTLDCPPDRLRRMVRPIATVTLRFDDGSGSAWVNVIEQRRGRPADAPPRWHAWFVRSRAGAPSATH